MASFLVLGVGACGGDDEDSVPQTDVAVVLREWEITVEPGTVPAGDVTFEIENAGELAHNLLVVKSDLPPGELPVAEDAVDTPRLNVAGSVGPIAPSTSLQGVSGFGLNLSLGKYVLLCDVVVREGGSVESHYRNGMFVSFLVEP